MEPLFINKTDEIIAFEVLDQIERLVNNDNLILVADDIVYESELNRFKESGIEMTLVRSNDKTENKMTVHFKWGDITYPIGFALGLERHEI